MLLSICISGRILAIQMFWMPRFLWPQARPGGTCYSDAFTPPITSFRITLAALPLGMDVLFIFFSFFYSRRGFHPLWFRNSWSSLPPLCDPTPNLRRWCAHDLHFIFNSAHLAAPFFGMECSFSLYSSLYLSRLPLPFSLHEWSAVHIFDFFHDEIDEVKRYRTLMPFGSESWGVVSLINDIRPYNLPLSNVSPWHSSLLLLSLTRFVSFCHLVHGINLQRTFNFNSPSLARITPISCPISLSRGKYSAKPQMHYA